MSLANAFKHKNNVTTIAERGVKLGRSAMLGVLYDELARFVCRSSFGFSFSIDLFVQDGMGGSVREIGKRLLH